jgi:hypothetical protein
MVVHSLHAPHFAGLLRPQQGHPADDGRGDSPDENRVTLPVPNWP